MIRQKKELRVKNDKGEESFQPWKEGDSWKHPDLQDIGVFKGFNDPSSGSVYIDSTRPPDEQVVTIAHELLHANASGDFQATLGKQVDEGMTEMLTQRAFASCGYSAPKGEYAQEVSFVEDLGSMVGEGMLVSAYWGGTATLRNMLNALTDTNIFDDFAKATRTKDRKWIRQFFKEYYEKLRGGSGLDKKIAAINLALDGWVSDNDISNIEGIYNGASPEEKVQLRGAIEPRITSLVNEGQRVRLRQLTGF
jgi:hypothetical protein